MHIITPHDPWSPKKKRNTWQEELWEQQQIAELEAKVLAEAQSKTLPPNSPDISVATAGPAVNAAAGGGGQARPAWYNRSALLNAAFTFVSSSKAAPSNVTITNTSTNGGPGTMTYLWDLGSGSITSTATTPAVQAYTKAGTYTITLTVTENVYNTVKVTTGQFTIT